MLFLTLIGGFVAKNFLQFLDISNAKFSLDYQSLSKTIFETVFPIDKDDVAAGEGALPT